MIERMVKPGLGHGARPFGVVNKPSVNTTKEYGMYYWKVHTSRGEVYLHADRMEVHTSGALIAWTSRADGDYQSVSFASGQWKYFYAASVSDGGAVSVEHWDAHRSKAA